MWSRIRAQVDRARALRRGRSYARAWTTPTPIGSAEPSGRLRDYFDAHTDGPGIWKWDHYFDIYERHFAKFVGTNVDVVEVGIYSGGSLGMWLDYFGPGCHVYGIDIEPACKAYESDRVTVLIGDQADRTFWRTFPEVDIVIDDGGHKPEQQIVTLEETLPRLRPGGVYLCEDVHGGDHDLIRYASGLVDELNRTWTRTTPFQRAVWSIHFYPYVVVIERRSVGVAALTSSRHGTEWQPFL